MPEIEEVHVQSLSWDDPLEEGMATHSSVLAWKILWTEEPSGLQSMGSLKVKHYWSHWAWHGLEQKGEKMSEVHWRKNIK